MRDVGSCNGLRLFRFMVAVALSAVLPGSAAVLGQATGAPADVHAQHAAQSSQANHELARQVAELRAQVAGLQEALGAKHQGHPATQPAMGGTGPMMPGRMAGSSGMGMGMAGLGRTASGMGGSTRVGMGAMSGGAGTSGSGMEMMGGMSGMPGMRSGGMASQGGAGMSGGMGMMDGQMGMMKGMMGMGAMPRMSGLPGFPGASHIYHIGATGFFLDHPHHITLTPEQQVQLNQIKEAALLEQATLQRQIDQAEQELWQLTSSDAPDIAKIEAKVGEITRLQADQRIAFIHAVGKAAGVLTEEQRKQLTGMLPPPPSPAGQSPSQAGGMGGMGDM